MIWRNSISGGMFLLGLLGFNLPALAQTATPTEAPAASSSEDAPLPPFPANCEPLPLVGGTGSEVTATASPPSINIPLPIPIPVSPEIRSNWNTDWYIANPGQYQTYQVMLMPYSETDYTIQMFLKYPDDTAEKFYDEEQIDLEPNVPILVEVVPERSDLQPYQVNTNIGGLLSIGARYRVAVAGCR